MVGERLSSEEASNLLRAALFSGADLRDPEQRTRIATGELIFRDVPILPVAVADLYKERFTLFRGLTLIRLIRAQGYIRNSALMDEPGVKVLDAYLEGRIVDRQDTTPPEKRIGGIRTVIEDLEYDRRIV